MIELYKGEKRNIYMQVSRQQINKDFIIKSVNCRVLDSNGEVVETGDGGIDSGLKRVYYFLDTTNEDILSKRNYWVEFQVSISGMIKLIIDRVPIKILK